MGAPTPDLVSQPFASSGSRNVIPNTTLSTQRASMALGFPPATMQPIDAGGVPPLGEDVNGILFACTQWLFALQGGQLQKYRADVSGALSGYALGAIVLMVDGAGYWINMTDGNTDNPDAGGSGWQPVYAYGSGNISGLTGGTRVLTAAEAARSFIVLTGTLASNLQVIVPDAWRQWIVVNGTSGAFTVTVKTAAGTGVEIPAGNFASPTAVYCNAVNVERQFVPSALPTSVAPLADTIVLRDNVGRQFAETAPVNARTSQVATTEFANPGGNIGAGWRMNADGTIEQWGTGPGAGPNRTVSFPVAFPNAVRNIQLTPRINSGDALGQAPTVVGAPALGTFTYAPPDGSASVDWRAIGN